MPAAEVSPSPRRVLPQRIRRLTDELDRPPGQLDRVLADFWDAVDRSGTPLVEPIEDDPDREEVTFLWRGAPNTERVVLVMSGLRRDHPEDAALERVPGTDVWFLGLRLRSDQRSSYRFAVRPRPDSPQAGPDTSRAGPDTSESHPAVGAAGADNSADEWRRLMLSAVPDPLNRVLLPGRWDQAASSILALSRAPEDSWTVLEDDHGTGSLVRHRLASRALNDERDVWVYRPPQEDDHDEVDHQDPVLVLCDGDRWFGELGLQHRLDAMINSGALPPLIVLAPDSVDLSTRWRELSAHDPYLRFLADELLDWASGRWHLTEDPSRTVIAGQSLGGLTAFYAGLNRPDRFGALLGQSPSLWWHPGLPVGNPHPVGVDSCWLAEQYAAVDRLPSGVELQVGLLEGQLVDFSRELGRVLERRGVPVTRTEYNGGHDYACWQVGLLDGLRRLASNF